MNYSNKITQLTAGDRLYLTKPIGIGILTTAQKQKKLRDKDSHIAPQAMCQLNNIGVEIAKITGVNALTDVTGFGLAGHLIEVCQGAKLKAKLAFNNVPLLPKVADYLAQGCVPGGTHRNFDSYGEHLPELTEHQKAILCDPQTSGGLLVAVNAESEAELQVLLAKNNIEAICIGSMVELTQVNADQDILIELT